MGDFKTPYVYVYAGRDIFMGPGYWSVAVHWKPYANPEPGCLRHQHQIELRVRVPQFKATWR